MRPAAPILFAAALALAGTAQARTFEMFQPGYSGCYDRKDEPHTFVVDAHNHFRPFGGEAVPFEEMLDYLDKERIFFVNIYGIGQKLPADSPCTYYLDCPGTPVTPSLSNDFVNAESIAARLPGKLPENLHITLAMTFPDLADPEEIEARMALLDREYPGMFTWMGEVNVVKQALFGNHHEAVPIEAIPRWKGFMDELERRKMPISFHSDLGNDRHTTEYLPLMEEILRLYPRNLIVWHHMGLSLQLKKIHAKKHIKILTRLLDENANLYLDISWRVLYDLYFKKPKIRPLYVKFLNKYHDRILPGTDFVAAREKRVNGRWKTTTLESYREDVEATSDILKSLSDEAFRSIALGGNYFKLLRLPFVAPKVCGAKEG